MAGRLPEAAAAYEKVLSTGGELLSARTRASIANNLGLIAVRQRLFERALVFFEQALGLLTAAEDAARRAQVMGNIGSVYRDREEGEPALKLVSTGARHVRESWRRERRGRSAHQHRLHTWPWRVIPHRR